MYGSFIILKIVRKLKLFLKQDACRRHQECMILTWTTVLTSNTHASRYRITLMAAKAFVFKLSEN